jgi:predicted transcriptional regulator of viral defense system
MAVPRNAWRPKAKGIRFLQYSLNSMKDGMEDHTIEGSRVRITTSARTVADCFKFRNKTKPRRHVAKWSLTAWPTERRAKEAAGGELNSG